MNGFSFRRIEKSTKYKVFDKGCRIPFLCIYVSKGDRSTNERAPNVKDGKIKRENNKKKFLRKK